MKTTYSYSADWWEKEDKNGRTPFGGTVTGITNADSKDIMGSVFRQHPDILSCSKMRLTYVELVH